MADVELCAVQSRSSVSLAARLEVWLPEDDLAHFVVAAVERVPLGAFQVAERAGGKPQYHPRLMLALLIYSYANGVFSSRRIERATYRDVAVCFVAANLHPDHDTIAVFRRSKGGVPAGSPAGARNGAAAAWHGVNRRDQDRCQCVEDPLGALRPGEALRAKLVADIAALTAQAEAADAEGQDPQAPPAEIARREVLKAKLDAACERLEADARAEAEAARPAYEAKRAAYEAKKGHRGRAPKPPTTSSRRSDKAI